MKNIKEITKKDYTKRMNRVLDHIQNHLDDELSLEELASIACFSRYHFHRIFSGMIGESLKAYIRRLRLERAAKQLHQTETAVTTIAFNAGFETHESFTRAFNKLYGVAPLHFRKSRQFPYTLPPINFWKETTVNVKIISMKDLDVVFIRHLGPYNQCGTAWEKLMQWAAPQGLLQPGAKILGLSFDDPQSTPPERLRYDACIEVKQTVTVEAPIKQKRIPGGCYAMFTHFGPYDTLAESYAHLCGQWVPQNGYEIDDRGCIEIYQNTPEDTVPEELITDIYIPLK